MLSQFTFRPDLALGDRSSVNCLVHRGDTPLTITWEKDGVPVVGFPGVHVNQIDSFNYLLSIEGLTPQHAGNYTCKARNDAAQVEYTAPLNVNGKPYIN